MTLFADPSFFVLLTAALVPAAALGLTGHSLRRYGLAVSLGFLACAFAGNPAQLAGLVAFLVLARAAVLWLAASPGSKARYGLAVAASLAPLAVYKLTATAGAGLWGFVGISYVTFKAVQVVIEVRDGLIGARDLGLEDWLYFLLFFPQFSSGPIDRSRRFAADAHAVPSRDEYAGLLARGILLLLAGAAYKFVLAAWVHRGYAASAWGSASGGADVVAKLWLQVRCAYQYGLYLFCDFQGYSLMAMGASYCLGLRCPRNFRAPFAAADIVDFWNRWHITLSTWFRDFVFMRFTRWCMHRRLVHGRVRTAQVAFMVDMLVMGLWHGIAPCYIAYGVYHGLLLGATEWMRKRSRFYRAHRHQAWFRVALSFVTLQLVMFGFAIFSGQVEVALGGVLNG